MTDKTRLNPEERRRYWEKQGRKVPTRAAHAAALAVIQHIADFRAEYEKDPDPFDVGKDIDRVLNRFNVKNGGRRK